MESRYEALKLDKQLCFPLYACSRSVIREYKPFLDQLDLTYTQYIAMLVLWEKGTMTVKELGEQLYLDSGTLTPLLKKLEHKGLITRKRSSEDERNLILTLTKAGMNMREEALSIPEQLAKTVPLEHDEAETLYKLLYKILEKQG
ncbi:MAG: MarR family transcriptional regulator [Clostridiales bacterium]|nr:MarR family transcriptional regulator [Clostridiales bacterium]